MILINTNLKTFYIQDYDEVIIQDYDKIKRRQLFNMYICLILYFSAAQCPTIVITLTLFFYV